MLSIIFISFRCTIQWLDNHMHTLYKVSPQYFQYTEGTINSYNNTVDYIPYAVLYIPMTIL